MTQIERIEQLSSQDLDLFKTQFRQRLKTMGELERNTALESLRGIPGLAETFQGPEIRQQPIPTDIPLWQKGLQTITAPLHWISETSGALLTAPWSPEVEGVEELSWLERQKQEYRQWEAPWGVKFWAETAPWIATTVATAGLGGMGMIGARTGAMGLTRAAQIGQQALKPVLAAERLAFYPMTKPMELAARKLFPKIAEATTRLIPNLQPVDEAIATAVQPSRLRSLFSIEIAGRQPLRAIAELIGGRTATANNPASLSLVGRDVLRFEGATKATVAIATLNKMGTSKKLFNLSDEGLMTIGRKQVHLNDIRTYPEKYWGQLNEQQRAWIDQAALLEREKKALFGRYDVPIRELTFEEGGEYAGRRVAAKFNSRGELEDVAYIGRGQPGRPGAKTASEKTRIFDSATEAVEAGYRYIPEEEALYYNITGAYNRVADKQFTDWFLSRVPHRTVAVAGMTGAARAEMREVQAALRQINGVALRLKNGESIPGQMLKGIKAHYPEEYEQIRLLVKQGYKQAEVDDLLKFVRREQNWHKKEWAQTQAWAKQARAEAIRPTMGETMAPDIPAFAGKVFTSPEAKEYINLIRGELNPGFHAALNAINQVNAVGRYFALAGDVSPFGIQLIFLAGAHPKIYGRAMGGFVRAMFDPRYHDNFLAKHAATIQRHPGLITTRGGATEFTEAMARGGLLRKGPLKIGGKVLEPFQRGFEASLDTAGVLMAETYEHLGTTAARMAQVDAFVNEFRGLLNTNRIGVSSTQRQLERAVILAPQYNRAVGALLWDLTQGNLRGQLARRAVGKGVAAIMAMTVAVSYALGDSEEEIIDHLNPLSTNFMTWDIAGQRIGPGSKVRSLLYTFGKMVKRPEDTAYHASRFLRGNFSPFLGTSTDLITGKDYMGDPTRDGLPSLTKAVLAENLLPIWVQSVALEGGDLAGRVTRGLAEFGGARGYPTGAYGEMLALQDKLAQESFGASWEELGMRPDGMVAQMRLLRESPELTELSERAEVESARWAQGEQLVWNEYTKRSDLIGNQVNAELNVASKQFEATGDGRYFRERVNRAYWYKSQMMKELLKEEQFTLVKETFEKPLTPEERTETQPQKLLYRDYNELMYAPDMFDLFGEYRFEEADKRRQLFIDKYGLAALESVEEVIGEKRADEPDAVKYLRRAREILRPYWEIADRVWANYSPQLREISDQIIVMENSGLREDKMRAKQLLFRYPQIVMARRMIALYRKQMKMQNPEMARVYGIFY